MSEQRTLLAEASVLLARAASLPLPLLDNEEMALVLSETEATGRLLDGLRVTVAAEVADRCRFSLGSDAMCHPFGYTKATHFVEYVTRISSAEASRRILLGSVVVPRVNIVGAILPPLEPIIADAVVSGDISTEVAGHLHRLVRKVSRCTPREKLDEVLTILVDQAGRLSCDLVAVQVREWIAILDTDGIEPREESQRRRRAFNLGREKTNGMTPFSGQLDPLSAGLVKAIFTDFARSAQSPYISDADRNTGTTSTDNNDGTTTVTEEDPRTRAQRQLDIVMGTLHAGLRASADLSGTGQRSTVVVSVVVQLADVQAQYDAANTGIGDGAGFGPAAERPTGGAGWVEEVANPVSTATIRRLLCDGDYNQILLGNAGEVLYLGRTHRRFSPAQRRALAIRDGGCVWPNCTIPAAQCDAHHVTEYSRGGPTHIDQAVLLCTGHHHRLHNSDFTLEMFGGKAFIRQPAWLDPSQTWQPLGHARGHVSAALTAQATLAAFQATAADLIAMANTRNHDDTDTDTEAAVDSDRENTTNITYADDLPDWYTPPTTTAGQPGATDQSDPHNTVDSTDPPEANDPPAVTGSLSESVPSMMVTQRKKRPGKSKPTDMSTRIIMARPTTSGNARPILPPEPPRRYMLSGDAPVMQKQSVTRRSGTLHRPPSQTTASSTSRT